MLITADIVSYVLLNACNRKRGKSQKLWVCEKVLSTVVPFIKILGERASLIIGQVITILKTLLIMGYQCKGRK